jgi:hypothetical protein
MSRSPEQFYFNNVPFISDLFEGKQQKKYSRPGEAAKTIDRLR